MTELSSGFRNSALQHLHTPIYFIYLLFCKAIFSKNVHTLRKSNFQDPFFIIKLPHISSENLRELSWLHY